MGTKRLVRKMVTPAVSLWRLNLVIGVSITVGQLGSADNAWAQVADAPLTAYSETSQLSVPYLTWVDDDVRWIITPEERSAYMAIKTNPERLEFIKEFWLRRNPDPASSENRFRDEHYRRIAYSNAHFAGTRPGWMTDRGRIYVIHGKPDSIDAHQTGGEGDTTPFEIWSYGGSAMKFVDACKCGDYTLESPPKL